jgi:lipoyl(octanoyl) transferase
MATTEPLRSVWLGRVPYGWALALQRARRDAIVAGTAPEVLWLLEHDPVVTVGRRAVPELGDEVAGYPVVRTERGGLATWHGPGQLVGYLLADTRARGWSVRGTVAGLEEGVIRWLAARGVSAARRAGAHGVWVGRDKICAVGLHFRRGVSMHGFALNLANRGEGFDAIVPCGITDGGVTSLALLGVPAPAPREAAASVGRSVLDALRPAF